MLPAGGRWVQVTTGSPERKLLKSVPGLMKPTSWNDAPLLAEMEAPLKLAPPGPNRRLSKKLPESLKPTTTWLPHHAVDVSLCVNPAIRENKKSVEGFEIGKLTAVGSVVGSAAGSVSAAHLARRLSLASVRCAPIVVKAPS